MRLVRSSSDRTVISTSCEDEAWRDLRDAIDSHKTQITKVRSEGVRESVDRAVTSMNALAKARDALYLEWRLKVKATAHEAADNKVADRVEALENRVLSVLDQVQLKLAEQDKILSNLPLPLPRDPEQEPKRTEVEEVERTTVQADHEHEDHMRF